MIKSKDVEQELRRLGYLHDARLLAMTWSAEDGSLDLQIEDLHAAFDGLPDDLGRASGALEFRELRGIQMDVAVDGALKIYKCRVTGEAPLIISFAFWPAGTLVVSCGELQLRVNRPGFAGGSNS